MKKLGEFERYGKHYVCFFDNDNLVLNYFCKNETTKDVECFQLNAKGAKEIIGSINSFQKMINNYKLLWAVAFGGGDIRKAKKFFLQVFPYNFWEECVLTEFNNHKVDSREATAEERELIDYSCTELFLKTLIKLSNTK